MDEILSEREIEIFPGQTSFEIISTNFEFVPTATPIPTAPPDATPEAEN